VVHPASSQLAAIQAGADKGILAAQGGCARNALVRCGFSPWEGEAELEATTEAGERQERHGQRQGEPRSMDVGMEQHLLVDEHEVSDQAQH